MNEHTYCICIEILYKYCFRVCARMGWYDMLESIDIVVMVGYEFNIFFSKFGGKIVYQCIVNSEFIVRIYLNIFVLFCFFFY